MTSGVMQSCHTLPTSGASWLVLGVEQDHCLSAARAADRTVRYRPGGSPWCRSNVQVQGKLSGVMSWFWSDLRRGRGARWKAKRKDRELRRQTLSRYGFKSIHAD